MKLNLNNSLIVVEGTTDKNYLSSFIDSSFYIVNGSAITSKDLEFLKLASKNKQIIILTDPDFPGMQIRNKINNYVKGCYNAFVKKELSIKNHKVGVAECDKNEILRALQNIKTFENSGENILNLEDLFELGLSGTANSKELRTHVSEYYNVHIHVFLIPCFLLFRLILIQINLLNLICFPLCFQKF